MRKLILFMMVMGITGCEEIDMNSCKPYLKELEELTTSIREVIANASDMATIDWSTIRIEEESLTEMGMSCSFEFKARGSEESATKTVAMVMALSQRFPGEESPSDFGATLQHDAVVSHLERIEEERQRLQSLHMNLLE